MKDKYILTAESVTAGHPDKLCDTIADSILDACLKEDPNARVACEVLATAGKILVAGELRTTASPDVEAIVRQTVRNAGYDCNYNVEVRLHTQSPDIAGAVDGDTLGAGDQGIMYGYACWETVELLPAPVVLANRITSLLTTCREEKLISGIGPDGKAQVSVQYAFGVPERVDTIVISCQHDADKDPTELREELRRLVIARACHDVRIDEQTKILINPSGRFVLGGFEADTGLTGRKLMVDAYGGLAPHGGGALSGKDGTKVDRSGAYMARSPIKTHYTDYFTMPVNSRKPAISAKIARLEGLNPFIFPVSGGFQSPDAGKGGRIALAFSRGNRYSRGTTTSKEDLP